MKILGGLFPTHHDETQKKLFFTNYPNTKKKLNFFSSTILIQERNKQWTIQITSIYGTSRWATARCLSTIKNGRMKCVRFE